MSIAYGNPCPTCCRRPRTRVGTDRHGRLVEALEWTCGCKAKEPGTCQRCDLPVRAKQARYCEAHRREVTRENDRAYKRTPEALQKRRQREKAAKGTDSEWLRKQKARRSTPEYRARHAARMRRAYPKPGTEAYEARRAANRADYLKHREQRLARQREYYEKNREDVLQYMRESRTFKRAIADRQRQREAAAAEPARRAA